MRVSRLIPLVASLALAAPAAAQEWNEYTSKQDLFIVNFPGEPTIREIPYPTEFGITLPARVYTAEAQGSRYSVTVVDYRIAEKLHTERAKTCTGYPDTCTNRTANDLRGALDYAVFQFLQRDGKVTYYGLGDTDRIEGRRVQLLNPDQSRTFGAVYMHELRLYVLEGTVPSNAPPPALFQQNVGIFDEKMERVRYRTLYRHGVTPLPEREPSPPGGRERGC
jgi:hypothetical protein